MQLRKAEIKDVESVALILRTSRCECLPYAVSPHSPDAVRSWIRQKLIPGGGVVVAQMAEKDVGILATSVCEGFGWIDQLYVAPGFIGQGVGSELLVHALNVLPRPIQLWTFQENSRARRFYEYHGFKAVEFTNGESNEEKCSDVLYEFNWKFG